MSEREDQWAIGRLTERAEDTQRRLARACELLREAHRSIYMLAGDAGVLKDIDAFLAEQEGKR